MDRREFLKLAGLVSISFIGDGFDGWAIAASQPATDSKRLVVIFLRGAVDGLSVVIPCGDPHYYGARPTIAIPEPGKSNGALSLDRYFGLHPALSGIYPLWEQRSLAFIHASGSPDPSRSHFDAQDYMESGTPGIKSTPQGWMNRLIQQLPEMGDPTSAVNFGPTIPRILKGKATVANIGIGAAGRLTPLDRPRVRSGFDELYSGDNPLGTAYQEAQAARKSLREDLGGDLKTEMQRANNGAPLVNTITTTADQVARLIRKNSRVRLVFIGVGGWDTHVNQGASEGQLAARLKQLGNGITTLAGNLGPEWRDTVVVVMSEFGRTVKENGNRGTDHGHGNVMWLLGGSIRGGKVYGDWPGLAPEHLYQGRDVAVNTDFREVLSTVLRRHLGLAASQIETIFPGFVPKKRQRLEIM